MKIGVSGASGHLGRAVVSELVQRPSGHELVAITHARKRLWTSAGTIRGLQPARKPCGGFDRLLVISALALEPGKRGARTGVKHVVGSGHAAGAAANP